MGQRAERIKSALVASHEYLKTLLLFLATIAALMATWYLWSARNSANVTGALAAKGMVILDRVSEKVDSIDAVKVINSTNETMQSVKARVDALTETQGEFNQAIASTQPLTRALTARINEAGANLTSLRSDTDILAAFIKRTDENLNSDKGTIRAITALVDQGRMTIKSTNDMLTKMTDEGILAAKDARALMNRKEVVDVLNGVVSDEAGLRNLEDALTKDATDADIAVHKFGDLMGEFQVYSHTANRYHKWLILSQIISNLAHLPLP